MEIFCVINVYLVENYCVINISGKFVYFSPRAIIIADIQKCLVYNVYGKRVREYVIDLYKILLMFLSNCACIRSYNLIIDK